MTQLPHIHLNGTSGHVLVREYADAVNAIENAITMAGTVTVHPRDYYVIDDHAARQASHEHLARMNKLREVRDELYLIYAGLLEQLLIRRLNEEENVA